MAALAAVASGSEGWWPSALQAAIRPEFAVERYVALPGDVLFGAKECSLDGCGYPARRTALELCFAHGSQLGRSAFSDVREWTAASESDGGPAPLRNRRAITGCAVPACARSAATEGLCAAHHQRWQRHRRGGISYERYVASTPSTFRVPGAPAGSCDVPSCPFPRRPEGQLCDHHHPQFRNRLLVDDDYQREDFRLWVEHPGRPVYSVARIASPLREEIQYALQCRSDERAAQMPRSAFGTVRSLLCRTPGRSLLDRDPSDPLFRTEYAGRFLTYARARVDELADAATGASEWTRDVWRLVRLPGVDLSCCSTRTISFDFCQQRWLREVIKRWARWRFSTGISPSSICTDIRALRRLVRCAEQSGDPLRSPTVFTRRLMEEFVTYMASVSISAVSRNRTLATVRTFLADCRRHDWMPGLDPRATYYRSDFGRRDEQLPRFLSEHVMARIECEDNLARLPSVTTRTTVEVLIGTGLRANDALRLAFDALSHDASGAPYLRYVNHKLSRERYIPISEQLAARVRCQQAWVRETYPPSCPHLLPRGTANPDGAHPGSYSALIVQLRTWQRACDIREADGTVPRVTPHRFRHTLATRMINRDVPQIAVQQMLDHNSPEMTRVYAKLHDSTLREHYDRYQERINVRGEIVELDPAGSLSDAAWAKERLGRAKLTLPNGYCGRPLQSHCPHPNACLTCPDFLTTREHLPAHRDQLASTIALIESATAAGHARIVDQNEQVRLNLIKIVEGLEALPEDDGHDGD
jgi:site-specific recombinase XerD